MLRRACSWTPVCDYAHATARARTLGPKGHMQVIIPDLTENYAAQEDPDETKASQSFRLRCSPKRHYTAWNGLSEFKALFEDQPQILENELPTRCFYSRCPESTCRRAIGTEEPPSLAGAAWERSAWEDCVAFGRDSFQKFFQTAALHVYQPVPSQKMASPSGPSLSAHRHH